MNQEELAKKMLLPSKNSRLEKLGKGLTFACLSLIVILVAMILVFVAQKGLSTFFVNGVNIFDFLLGGTWNPSSKEFGALPMILGSFIVTILSALIATPFAIGAAVFMTEVSPKGAKILQPAIELLVGIPSVVYGFIGLQVVVPFVRSVFGGTGFGILSGISVLFVMILPTVTFMTTDSLRAVPRYYREASFAMGATRWQTIWRVILKAARSGIFTAVVFGMARAFGEALAIQMVVGNSAVIPTSLTTPAATLTSILTMGIGNTVMGTVNNNVLWSLALVLLLMSLVFNSVIKLITKERGKKIMRAKKLDKLATAVLYTIASIIVTILASLILYILVRGLPHISWSFLTGRSSAFQAGGGIGIQLYNSFFLLVITLIISVPLSMGAGIYLAEYAKKGPVTNFVRTCIEILSSLPSVVVGLFGYLIFVVQFEYGFSIISGALALTVFNLPQMTRNVEDSLKHVHHTQREAGLALGISRWETVVHVVIPEALPGIVTGVVLASGRIFGEAAALIYTAGQSAPALDWSNWNILSVTSPISIFRQAETLAVHIWKVNSEGTIPDGTIVSAGSAAVLLIFILIFNFGARKFGSYLHKKLTAA